MKVEVYERNQPDDAFGWGVVFSGKTMSPFMPPTPRCFRIVELPCLS
jgi:hypothetical protein